jgi:hypothetical protein
MLNKEHKEKILLFYIAGLVTDTKSVVDGLLMCRVFLLRKECLKSYILPLFVKVSMKYFVNIISKFFLAVLVLEMPL